MTRLRRGAGVLFAGLLLAACAAPAPTPSPTPVGRLNSQLQNSHVHTLLLFGSRVVIGDQLGLHYSNDLGVSWTDINQADPAIMYTAMAAGPCSPTAIYASGVYPLQAARPAGLWRSLDAGQSWQALGGLPASTVWSLVLAGECGREVAVVVDRSIYGSIDQGDHWSKFAPSPFNPPTALWAGHTSPAGVYLDEKVVWVMGGLTGLATSVNTGAWRPEPALFGTPVYTLVAPAAGPSAPYLLAGSGSGLWQMQFDGNWSRRGTLTAPISRLVVAGQTLFAIIDGIPQLSQDSGLTWSGALPGLPTRRAALIAGDSLRCGPADPPACVGPSATLLVGYSYPLRLYRSDDGGKQWKALLP